MTSTTTAASASIATAAKLGPQAPTSIAAINIPFSTQDVRPSTNIASNHVVGPTSPRSVVTGSAPTTAIGGGIKKKTSPSGTGVPPRKRSKVSRACDECRRKKIRCDASAEEDPQCTSCRRAGEKCSFSRIPMKRGPSKRPRWDHEHSPSDDKRIQGTSEFVLTQPAHLSTTSSSSAAGLPTNTPNPTTISSTTNSSNNTTQHFNRLPSIDTLTSPQIPSSLHDTSPKSWPRDPSPIQRAASISSAAAVAPRYSQHQHHHQYRHPSVSSDSGGSTGGGAEMKRYSEPDEPGWDDRCIDSYFQMVHPGLPILPSSKVRLRSRLSSCSNPTLRYTLLCGVNGLVKRDAESRAQILQGVLQVFGSATSTLDNQSRILYLTTLILLFLQTGESMWLGSAVSLSYDMLLHLPAAAAAAAPSSTGTPQTSVRDPEDDANLSRRLFLVLVILDRLHASLKGTPVLIPDEAINLDAERDSVCFGSMTGVQIVRLCIILGHGSRFSTSSSPAGLFQELEQAYQTIESMWDTTPILKAVYYLVLVRFDWISIQTRPADKRQVLANTLNDAAVLTTLLESPLISVSPLIGYFVPPLVSTLLDIAQHHHLPINSEDSDAALTLQFRSQLEFLDSLIQRRFPDYESLRREVAHVRMSMHHHHLPQQYQPQQQQPQQHNHHHKPHQHPSPNSKLEGLAAVAHAHATSNPLRT